MYMRHSRRKRRPLLYPWVLAFLLGLPLFTKAAEKPDAGATLTLTFRETPIQEVYEMLSREGNANILLGKDVQGEVSVNLYRVDLDTAIRYVAEAAGYVVERMGPAYIVLKREDAGQDFIGGNTQVRTFKVQYTEPEKVSEILSEHLSRYGKITTLKERGLIVVRDLPDFLDRCQALLDQIDHQPDQILIEAKILEVILTGDQSYGIDWTHPFGSHGGVVGTTGLATADSGLFLNLFNPGLELKLTALNNKGLVRTLSTPQLLLMEDQEAQVLIGDRVGYKVTTIVNQVVTESVEFIESGVILKVKAAVDRAGRILLDVHPEISTSSVTDGIPSLKTTEVTTQFLAEDGQKIFIGGLIKKETGQEQRGVPGLSDIPGLGALFSETGDRVLNTETVVLITPHVVNMQKDQVTARTAERIHVADRSLSAKVDDAKQRIQARHEPPSKDTAGPAAPSPGPEPDPLFWWNQE